MTRAILYVGDDESTRLALAREASRQGYLLEALADPTQTLRVLERAPSARTPLPETAGSKTEMARTQFHDKYWVVLLDLDPASREGLELIRSIKAYDSGIAVIVLSSHATLTSISLSRVNGAEAFLAKPLGNLDELFDEIAKAFGKVDHWWQTLSELSRRTGQSLAAIA